MSLHAPLGPEDDGELGQILVDEGAPSPLEWTTGVLREEALADGGASTQ